MTEERAGWKVSATVEAAFGKNSSLIADSYLLLYKFTDLANLMKIACQGEKGRLTDAVLDRAFSRICASFLPCAAFHLHSQTMFISQSKPMNEKSCAFFKLVNNLRLNFLRNNLLLPQSVFSIICCLA